MGNPRSSPLTDEARRAASVGYGALHAHGCTLGDMSDLPPELRGVSPDPVREHSTPLWVRVTALVALLAMLSLVLWSAF